MSQNREKFWACQQMGHDGFLLLLAKPLRVSVQFSSVAQSCLILRPHELQHARPPCPPPTPGVYPNSCPSSRWCPQAISSSVVPFSSCSQPLQASGSFPLSQLFSWGGQSIGVSASASVLWGFSHLINNVHVCASLFWLSSRVLEYVDKPFASLLENWFYLFMRW